MCKCNKKISKIEHCKFDFENRTVSEAQREIYAEQKQIKDESLELQIAKATIVAKMLRSLEKDLNKAYINHDVVQFNFYRYKIKKWLDNFYKTNRVAVGEAKNEIRIWVSLNEDWTINSKIESILNDKKSAPDNEVHLSQ